MKDYSVPEEYWETRLSQNFNLVGVGYIGLGEYYNSKLYKARLRILEEILARNHISLEGKNILDIGCGTGFYTNYFYKQNVASYTGLDITQVSIQALRTQYPNYDFIHSDIGKDEVSFPIRYDIVLMADVLYHIISDEEFEHALEQACKAINHSGILIVADVFPAETYQVGSHVRLRSLEEYRHQLSVSGFKTNSVDPIFVLLHPPISNPEAGLGYQAYLILWRLFHQLTKFPPFEYFLSNIYYFLDEKIFLGLSGNKSFSIKWLYASSNRAEQNTQK